MSHSTRRESGSNVYHFTAYPVLTTQRTQAQEQAATELAKRTANWLYGGAVAAFGWRWKKSECKGKGRENEQEKSAKVQQKKRRKKKMSIKHSRAHSLNSALFLCHMRARMRYFFCWCVVSAHGRGLLSVSFPFKIRMNRVQIASFRRFSADPYSACAEHRGIFQFRPAEKRSFSAF